MTVDNRELSCHLATLSSCHLGFVLKGIFMVIMDARAGTT